MATFPVDIVVSTPGAQQLAPLNRQLDQTDRAATGASTAVRALGAAVAAIGVGSAVKQAISVNREFNKSISELSAITGATGRDLKFLTDASKEFGATTTLTASQAATAFKLIASAKPDLLSNVEALKAVTREAIALSEAAGIDLPAAANALGNSLNQFGADASEAGRFINVLAAGAKFGSSSIAETAEALKNAGVSAANAKVSFEQTNAAIQALSTSGLRGAEAGTGLRNVLTILDTAADKNLRPSVVGLAGALENLAAQQLDNTEFVKLFGRENQNAARILLNQRENFIGLTAALTGTTTAYEQAATNVDNLNGDMLALASAFEGVQIEAAALADGGLRDITQALTVGLQGLNENPERIAAALDTIGVAATAVAAVMAGRLTSSIATSTQLFITNTTAGLAAKTQYDALGLAISRTTVAANVANASMSALGRTMTFLGGPVGIILLAATALTVFSSNADSAERATKALNAELNTLSRNQAVQALRDVGNVVDELQERVSKGASVISEFERTIRIIEAAGGNADSYKNTLIDLRSTFDGLSQDLEKNKNRQQELRDEVEGVNFAYDLLNTTVSKTATATETAASNVLSLSESYSKVSAELATQIALIQQSAREAAITAATAKLTADATEQERQATASLAGTLFDLAEARKKSDDNAQQQKAAEDRVTALNNQLEALKLTGEAQAVYNATAALDPTIKPETVQAIRDATSAIYQRQEALRAEQAITQFDQSTESPIQRIEREAEEVRQANLLAYEQGIQDLEAFKAREVAITTKAEADKTKAVEESSKGRIAAEKQALSQALSLTSNVFGSIADVIADAKGKESKAYKVAFLASKAAAIAQAVIQTESAAIAALALPPIGLGPVAGVPYAGVIRGLGYASIGVMAGQAISGFANGGDVVGPGTGRSDSILAYLSDGEKVMTAQRTAQYRKELNAMERGTFNANSGGNATPRVTIINNVSDTATATVSEGPDGELIATIDRRIADRTPGVVAGEIADPYSQTTRTLNSMYRLERN